MKRSNSYGKASVGVHHIAKIVSVSNCIFQSIDQQNDLGNDAYIEFVIDEMSTGCCIAAQIKSGASYVRNGSFVIPVDKKHYDYWRSHVLPICGFVYDPKSELTRWVDITSYLADEKLNPSLRTIRIPAENIFDGNHFHEFRDHFLKYRTRYSDSAHFGDSLRDFAHVEDLSRCRNAIRALFSFHRNRPETWYFLISCLSSFRNHPLLQHLVVTLAYVPGHGDIWWGQHNIISEPTRQSALSHLERSLSRDLILTLVSAIDPEGGITRGTIGQCVYAIIERASDRGDVLESIVFDKNVGERIRYWSLIHFLQFEQYERREHCLAILERALGWFPAEDLENLHSFHYTLKEEGFLDFS